MTFDLHYDPDHQAQAFRDWVTRIYTVSATLKISYSELWDLPEQEFLVLEEISKEVVKAKKERQEELRNNV